jgi:hypothetical protein
MDAVTDAPSLRELYETDFYAWTRVQADSLRRLAEEPVGQALGADRLADDVEAMGRERQSRVHELAREIMALLLQLRCGTIPEFTPGWRSEVKRTAQELRRLATPSLQRDLEGHLGELYAAAAELAERRLQAREDRFGALGLPLRSPWGVPELLATAT